MKIADKLKILKGRTIPAISCKWHEGDKPLENDFVPGCPDCGREYDTGICEGCGKLFLDWSVTGPTDVFAHPRATAMGDMSCSDCIREDSWRGEDEFENDPYEPLEI